MNKILFLIMTFFLSACASTDNGIYKKSSQVENTIQSNIPSYWSEVNNEGSDFALINNKTKSFFLFNSACRKFEVSSLNALTSSILSGIDDLKILEKKNVTYQQREATDVLASGRLDGIERYFKIVTIQKNNCIYDYVLISQNKKMLENDKSDFLNFLQRIILK